MKLKGKVFKFGANIDTDIIIPARYLNISEGHELARHCMEGLKPDFSSTINRGDIIVATTNFGCGSSREHAPLAIKAAGISCVVAAFFARIFFRNAVNIGLPVLECEGAALETDDGDLLEVELSTGKITNLNKNKVYTASKYPDFMLGIISAGGLVEYTKKKLKSGRC